MFVGVINDFDAKKEFDSEAYSTDVILQNDITMSYLKLLSFDWPCIDESYIKLLINDMKDKGFLY